MGTHASLLVDAYGARLVFGVNVENHASSTAAAQLIEARDQQRVPETVTTVSGHDAYL